MKHARIRYSVAAQKSINIYSYLFLPGSKMELERTVSDKGQVVIPRDVRKKLGLKPGSEIVFDIIDNDRAVIRMKKDNKKIVDEFCSIPRKKAKSMSIKKLKSLLDEQYEVS